MYNKRRLCSRRLSEQKLQSRDVWPPWLWILRQAKGLLLLTHRAGRTGKTYYLRYSGNSSKDYINKSKCFCVKALALWTKLGIEKAHVVSHDMGDSVLTEILTRCLHQIDFFKSQLFLDWNVAPCLIGLPTSSRVSSSPTEEWDTTSSTLDLLRWNFQFSIFNSRYRLINLRPAQVEFSFHCNPIPYFFIQDSPEIILGESFGRIWIKVSVEI